MDLKINDVLAKFLVDTGATISLVSNNIFYALDKSKRPEVRPLGQTIVTANGTNLSSIGQSVRIPSMAKSAITASIPHC
jgi:predicted aspartyl protease